MENTSKAPTNEYAVDENGKTYKVHTILGQKIREEYTPVRVIMAIVIWLAATNIIKDRLSSMLLVVICSLVAALLARLFVLYVNVSTEELNRYKNNAKADKTP